MAVVTTGTVLLCGFSLPGPSSRGLGVPTGPNASLPSAVGAGVCVAWGGPDHHPLPVHPRSLAPGPGHPCCVHRSVLRAFVRELPASAWNTSPQSPAQLPRGTPGPSTAGGFLGAPAPVVCAVPCPALALSLASVSSPIKWGDTTHPTDRGGLNPFCQVERLAKQMLSKPACLQGPAQPVSPKKTLLCPLILSSEAG